MSQISKSLLDLLRNLIRPLKSPFLHQLFSHLLANLFRLGSKMRIGPSRWPLQLAPKSSIFPDKAGCARGLFLIIALLFAADGYADHLIVENLTSYPEKIQNSKIAIQWANTAREIEAGNQALITGSKLSQSTMQLLSQLGKVKVTIPQRATYFRVLAWSKGDGEPDFHTNWVEIISNKTYTLKSDHLIPSVLMSGMGC